MDAFVIAAINGKSETHFGVFAFAELNVFKKNTSDSVR